jgi:tetratricopeptide (TPR) repeat protein
MKRILPLVLIAAALVAPAMAQSGKQPTAASQAEALFRQGQAAEKTGNIAAAQTAYTEALRANPNHAAARFSLGQLRINAPALVARARERKFGDVMIPELRFDQATFREALDALGKIVEKESKDEVTPNFVIQDATNKLGTATISLNLKNVPARTALKYLMDMSGARARYDEHAIVIEPRPRQSQSSDDQ